MILAAIDAATAAAAIAVLVAVGGVIVSFFRIGPERTNIVVTYQAKILDDLQQENNRLLSENNRLLGEAADYIERIDALEEQIKLESKQRQQLERRIDHLVRRTVTLEHDNGGEE